MKKKTNDLAQFLVGLVMLVAGGFAFANNVIVTTGFYSWRIGTFSVGGGLVVVPFIVGVIMLFVMEKSFPGKVVCGLGLLIILISVIMSTRIIFRATSLYVYLLMLVGIFGGAALMLKVLLKNPKGKDQEK